MKTEKELFIEVEHAQLNHDGQSVCGDCFKSCKLGGQQRMISVLSDGLGSGVKASILSTMTATMALKFMSTDSEIVRSAAIMMEALPVCAVRKISYATFTIIDTGPSGRTRIIEMDNPAFILMRDGKRVEIPHEEMAAPGWEKRKLHIYELNMKPEDRLIVFSDGISQAGMGTPGLPLGWRREGCAEVIHDALTHAPDMSARALARRVLHEALMRQPEHKAIDDMTCGVVYFRHARQALVLTGPPFAAERDQEYAQMVADCDGHIAICGGTTANIIGRELGREIKTSLRGGGGGLPPVSKMQGVELVTEGILTLTQTASILESDTIPAKRNAAVELAEMLRESDHVRFVVGTRINEAHQDPTLPVDLEIRRNIVKRIAKALEKRYLKQVDLEYI